MFSLCLLSNENPRKTLRLATEENNRSRLEILDSYRHAPSLDIHFLLQKKLALHDVSFLR